MSEHKKVHFFCEEDDFSLDILFYRQRDGFASDLAREYFPNVLNNISFDKLNVIRFFVKFCVYYSINSTACYKLNIRDGR